MLLRQAQRIFFIFSLFIGLTLPCYAFEQSIEFLPGYKAPDSASDGAPTFDLRYFLHFPSLYLSAGIGIGYLQAPANHKNLEIGSKIKMMPVGFTLRLSPPIAESFTPFFEVGLDRLAQLHYRLDPAVDTGASDTCDTEFFGFCHTTSLHRKAYAYRLGIGIEKVFASGIGLGFQYTYRIGKPVDKSVNETPSFGILPVQTTHEGLFDIQQSLFSLLMSYHF
ncbi:MAG: hypothetical protein HY282_07900 [Nitrospirae bacterium]|nr:hypothetical protein [Candidatus Manganitrophaceae bacterium]